MKTKNNTKALKNMKLEIFDCVFSKNIDENLIKNCDAFLLIFSVVNLQSFLHLNELKKKIINIKKYRRNEIKPILIIGFLNRKQMGFS